MKSSIIAVASVVLMVLVLSLPALAGTISLVPSSSNVAPGGTVDVSVVLSGSTGFTMTAMNAVIYFDPLAFTYMDLSVVQGAFLTDDWSPMGAATTPGELRVGAIDWTNPSGELLASGSGTLFTFKLLANGPLGLSSLTWGDAGGGTNGFDYGDADFNDIVLTSSGTSINVANTVPEPSLLLLLGFGLGSVYVVGWRFRA
jgi:hypothetical protein